MLKAALLSSVSRFGCFMAVRMDAEDITLHGAGASHARSLIGAGKYDNTSGWSFSAEDGDKLLGKGGNDWSTYGSFHLGEDADEAKDTKAHWKYPFGKDGKVYGAALRAIRSRASQQGAKAIFDEAGKLLDEIKTKEGGGKEDSARILPFARGVATPSASGYRMAARGDDAAEIYLYGTIGASIWGGGISANQFSQDLKGLGPNVKTIDLRINSDGGDVFDGKAIYTLLQQHQAKIAVHVDGLAASAASFIAMAGDTIEMAEGAFMMVHNAWGFAMGDAAEMRRTADLLDAVSGTIVDTYAARTKQKPEKIKEWMDAETWMTGKECLDRGFCDKVVENQKVAACVADPARFRNLPAPLRPNRTLAARLLDESRNIVRGLMA